MKGICVMEQECIFILDLHRHVNITDTYKSTLTDNCSDIIKPIYI